MLKRIIILLILFSACTNNKTKSDNQILDFSYFTIETPKSWTKVKAHGIDSYVGKIAIDSIDTVQFDLGSWSNNLHEMEPQIIDRSLIKNAELKDTSDYIIVEHRMEVDPDKYKKNNIGWDTIDGYRAKIVFPIKSGIGTTGIYIDSLWESFIGNERFNLYGTNLKSENEKLLLEAIKTLKFHKPK